MSVTDRVRRSSSPSSSSEQLELQSSSAPQESAQQLGAPLGLAKAEALISNRSPWPSLSPPTPGRVGSEGRQSMSLLFDDGGPDLQEFMDATEVGYIDSEFTPMWWRDAADHKSRRAWAVKDGDRVLLYVFNNGM